MEFARRPPELSSMGSMDLNWRNWKQQFIAFLKVSSLVDDEPEVNKIHLMLNLIGPVGLQAYHNFDFDSPSDKENMDIVLEKFNEYYDPKKSEAHERNNFFTTKKREKESIEQYINELRAKARTCNFGELADSLIRDKIVLEANNRALRKHLLSEPDLSLSQTLIIWQMHDQTAEKVRQVRNDGSGKGSGYGAADTRDIPSSSRADHRAKNDNIGCRKCGTRHAMRNCPAWGKKCGNCNAPGHFTEYCQSSPAMKNNSHNNENNKAAGMSYARQQNFAVVHNVSGKSFNRICVNTEAVSRKATVYTNNIKTRNKSSNNESDCCVA